MIACPESARLLSRIMDGKLSPLKRLVLATHLKSCPDCARCEEHFHHLRVIMRRWKH